MAKKIIMEPSRTLAEFRLLPGLTTEESAPERISLRSRIASKARLGRELWVETPLVAAAMQAVAGPRLCCELARLGGVGFVFCSQSIEEQAKMVKEIAETTKQLPKDSNVARVGAALNTHDYVERATALVAAGAEILCIDSSDGFSIYVERTLKFLHEKFPKVAVIAGNIITAEGFRYLARAGADCVKVGMGGGSICITQEQKGTGRGLATAVLEVTQARDAWARETGEYIPIIADGGITHAKEATMALALGADVIMMGRYFARMEESPSEKITIHNRLMKPYWGEGSARASEWKQNRYHQNKFNEGVEGFVEYAGTLSDNLAQTTAKIKASLSSCGSASIAEFHANAIIESVSGLSIREGQVHDIYQPGMDSARYEKAAWGE